MLLNIGLETCKILSCFVVLQPKQLLTPNYMNMKSYLFTLFAFFTFGVMVAQDINYISEIDLEKELEKGSQQYEINDSISYVYGKPRGFSFAKNAWKDMYEVPKSIWKKESIKPALIVVASTALLVALDDKIYDGVRNISRFIGLDTTNNTKNISPINGVPLHVPLDVPSSMYYLGDGITELAICAGFLTAGVIKNDNRSMKVASQLAEGMISVGVYVQILKHFTMHETPMRRDMPEYPRGRWKFFDVTDPVGSIKEYHSSVPSHDAWPSGHLSIAMMTTTVIALNYPEKRWIKPVGYSLMGLCGFQMINNGVHWASDYPFAIGMGYVFGKVIANRGHLKFKKEQKQREEILGERSNIIKPEWNIKPAFVAPGVGGLRLSIKL